MPPKVPKEPRLEPLYLSPKETCRAGSFSSTTLYRLIAAEKLVAVKVGSKTLIEVESLKTYLASLPRFIGRTGASRKAV
jgi:excisionase family DNA binding protein